MEGPDTGPPTPPRGSHRRRSRLAAQIDPSAILKGQEAGFSRLTRAQQETIFNPGQPATNTEPETEGEHNTEEAVAPHGTESLMEGLNDTRSSSLTSFSSNQFRDIELPSGHENNTVDDHTSDDDFGVGGDDWQMFEDGPSLLPEANIDDPAGMPQLAQTDSTAAVADALRAALQQLSEIRSDPAYLRSQLEAQGYQVIPPNASQDRPSVTGAQHNPAEAQPNPTELESTPTEREPNSAEAQPNPAEAQQQVDQSSTGQGDGGNGGTPAPQVNMVPQHFNTPCVGCTRRMARAMRQFDVNDRESIMSVSLCLIQTKKKARKCNVCRQNGRKCEFIPAEHATLRTNAQTLSDTFRRIKYEGYIIDDNDRQFASNIMNDLDATGLA